MRLLILVIRFISNVVGEIKYRLGIRDFRPSKKREEYLIGFACYMQRKFQEGADHLEKFVEKNPEIFQAWYTLGRCYFDLEKYNEARYAFEKALALNYKFPDPYIYCGILDVIAFEFQSASENLSKALKYKVKESPLTISLLALVELYQTRVDDALRLGELAYELDNSNANIVGNLALIYHLCNMHEKRDKMKARAFRLGFESTEFNELTREAIYFYIKGNFKIYLN